jgi:PhzF family phenazine biosynthesis protein
MKRIFAQVDVFGATECGGNPLAVVLGCEGLSTEKMQHFANWTNLSETTFIFPPMTTDAHYRVRIFTPVEELPFAGHPTLGTCHAWLSQQPNEVSSLHTIVQECGIGLVTIRKVPTGLAFRAPPLSRSESLTSDHLSRLVRQLGLRRSEVVDARRLDNGVSWVAVLLRDADAVLRLTPDSIDEKIGVIGSYLMDSPEEFEVRAFFPKGRSVQEDPVTGSLNASLAQWLLDTQRVSAPYLVKQGTMLGRTGRVYVTVHDDHVWIGGSTRTLIDGFVGI